MHESDDSSISEDETLLHENSAIFSILPLLIQGLFHWESHLAILLKFLQNQIGESDVLDESQMIQLQAIYSQIQAISEKELEKNNNNQKDVMVIDEDKSLLLTFTFGRVFADALSILSDPNNINVIVYCEEGTAEDLVNELALDYLQGNFEPTGSGASLPISIKVTQEKQIQEHAKTRVSKKRMAEISQRLAYLDLERMLTNAGLTINDAGELTVIPKPTRILKDVLCNILDLFLRSLANSDERIKLQKELDEAVATKRELNIVDLKSWYCSCDDFQASYVSFQDTSYGSDDSGDPECVSVLHDSFPSISPLRMIDADKLIAKFHDNQITRYFRSLLPQNQTRHLSTLPVCCHLLALCIAATDSPYTHRYFTVVTLDNLWSMLT